MKRAELLSCVDAAPTESLEVDERPPMVRPQRRTHTERNAADAHCTDENDDDEATVCGTNLDRGSLVTHEEIRHNRDRQPVDGVQTTADVTDGDGLSVAGRVYTVVVTWAQVDRRKPASV